MNYKTKLTRRVSKNIRRSLGAWNYRYWLSRLQMSCEDNRVAFRSVPAYYTSQRCPVCGHTERKNRNLDEFKCQECDYAGNAHTIAGCNILLRFLSGPYGAAYKPKDLGSLIPKFS
jgi:transposase